MADSAELIVAGAGLNGMLLAAACAGAGLTVAVVDPQDPAAMLESGFDGRTSAIAYGSKLVLDGIGIWPAIAAEAEPILEIRVADDDAPSFLHFDHRDFGDATPLGYIVENRVLRRALFDRADALPSLQLLGGRRIAAVEAAAGGVAAVLDNGQRLDGRLVAATDGRESPLRRGAGIRAIEWRYRQTSIVTTVAHARPHAGIAIEHFFPPGPFAILPMTGNRSSIVWTEHSALVPAMLALSEEEFGEELRVRFGEFLGALTPVGPRWSYPLALLLAERYIAPRLALAGEAAHVIHPIAGQGLNLGIRDVALLSELIVDQRRRGLDIGDDRLLERYEGWRRGDAVLMAVVTDGLNRLFSNAITPVKFARDTGLATVNRLLPLRRALMRHAMGFTSGKFRLGQGEPL
jgi:2-octaprenyl-6-methoxyphenol hydroxylase